MERNFRVSQPTASLLFGGILFPVAEATELLVNHSIMNVPKVIVVCKRLGTPANPNALKQMNPEKSPLLNSA